MAVRAGELATSSTDADRRRTPAPPCRGILTLEEIEQLLKELPHIPQGKAVVEANLDLIRRLGEPTQILAVLERILTDPFAISQNASRSYHHVNHFDKIVLIDSERSFDYRLTIHLWLPPYSEKQLNEELIHDHRFSFWSNILAGSLISENYLLSEHGNAYQQYRYIPEERDALNFYQFMGEARLAASGIVKRNRGAAYFLSHERIHRVRLPREDMVCTLVLRGPRACNYSNVYNTVYPNQNFELTPTMFSPRQLRGKLVCLVDELAGRI
jgi:hypothetical protein